MAGCNLCEHWSIRSSQFYRPGGVCFRRLNRFYGYFDHRGDVLALQRNVAYFSSPSFGRAESNEALIESKLFSLSFPGESQGIRIDQAEFTTDMNIHFTGLKNIDRPGVLLIRKVTVCLECGD